MLTEEELEAVARRYCNTLGLDPDEQVNYSHPSGYAIARWRPRWKEAAEEVSKFHAMRDAFEAFRI